MAFKYIFFAAFIAVAKAGVLAPAPLAYAGAPIAKTIVADEYDPNPQYQFGYDVQDGLTGDSKNQIESRNGDTVQGQYSLIESDGTRRIVDYFADPINGFNAQVRKEPLAAKAIVAAPAITKVAAPLAYSAPLPYAAPLSYHAALPYSAPLAKLGAPLAYSTSVLH